MDANENAQPSPEEPAEDAVRPKKRVKTVHPDVGDDSKSARHSKSCSNCRRLKVKCEWTAKARDCSRCTRLSLTCLREKKSWTHTEADGGNESTQLAISKLSRALEDVLEKLNMPALDLYALPAMMKPNAMTRRVLPTNLEERPDQDAADRERDVSPDPMNSLMEATRMNGLRSQLRPGSLRVAGGLRRKETDCIAKQIISIEDAERFLKVFQRTQSHHLFSASIAGDATVDSLRASSTVLFTAVIVVGSLLVPGKEALHEACYEAFMGLVSSVMFDRFHSLDDIRGLCIAALWQPYLSWKLSGLSIRMATELNLHHALYYYAFHDQETTAEERKESLEKTRLWYLLFVVECQSSIAYGRPPAVSELRPPRDFEIFLASDSCTTADRALVAQVTGLVTLSRAFDIFGLEPRRTMAGDDASVLEHSRFTASIQEWRDRWRHSIGPDDPQSIAQTIELQFHFSNLVLNSLVLRGRPLHRISELPTSLRPLALKAIEAAHSILQHFLEDPRYGEEIVGMPLYLHSIIAFAVVFLMKLAPRWSAIGITIDATQRTLPLVERIIQLLQGCRAGTNHMVFSMAKGFERMLRQLRKQFITATPSAPTVPVQWSDAQQQAEYARSEQQNGNNAFNVYSSFPPTADFSGTPGSNGSNIQYSHWDFQDEELWSVGMGYDLLDPGGQGLANLDFPIQSSTW